MNNLYSNQTIEDLKRKKKNSLIVVISVMVSATLLNVGLLFLSTEYNRGLMEFILSFIYVVSGWVSLYFLINGVIRYNRKIKSINSILQGDALTIDGTIYKIDKPVTLSNSSRCYEIVVKKGYEEHKLYFDESLKDVPFKEDENVKFMVSNNFIIGYEVIEDEIEE